MRYRNLVPMTRYVRGSGLCPWSPTVALHALLNSGLDAALMCLDSLRLSNCARNPHDSQRRSKLLKFLAWNFLFESLQKDMCFYFVSCAQAVCKGCALFWDLEFSVERHAVTLLSRS
ncbi:hypothetical protein M9H77_30402 [Catharanthus roseus]|uniref:Uncharacterized protein n=1 Tax=Catharanthus roseus TaxID=4058 RepID=A0ACB9ZX51_CATRO|nr:hypothetical protein M9H77_30402 [Catharanthus roseus]